MPHGESTDTQGESTGTQRETIRTQRESKAKKKIPIILILKILATKKLVAR